LMLTIQSKQRTSDICMTKSSYNVPTRTKTMVLPTTFMSFQQLTPRQQAQERSVTSQHSHDISRRSDTPRTSNQPLRSTTVALIRVYGSRCKTLRRAPLEATKITWRDISPL
jgi:hypothetical protein